MLILLLLWEIWRLGLLTLVQRLDHYQGQNFCDSLFFFLMVLNCGHIMAIAALDNLWSGLEGGQREKDSANRFLLTSQRAKHTKATSSVKKVGKKKYSDFTASIVEAAREKLVRTRCWMNLQHLKLIQKWHFTFVKYSWKHWPIECIDISGLLFTHRLIHLIITYIHIHCSFQNCMEFSSIN